MNIQIKDEVGLSATEVSVLVRSLLEKRQPKDGSFDYGLETHGMFEMFGITLGISLPHPIQVFQSNKRKSDKSPIIITINRHRPII